MELMFKGSYKDINVKEQITLQKNNGSITFYKTKNKDRYVLKGGKVIGYQICDIRIQVKNHFLGNKYIKLFMLWNEEKKELCF